MTTEEMILRMAEIEHRAESNTRRVEKLELQTDAIQSIATSVEILVREHEHQTEAMDRIEKNVEGLDKKLDGQVGKLDKRVNKLEERPGKLLWSIAEKVLMLIIGAVMAVVFSKIGLG